MKLEFHDPYHCVDPEKFPFITVTWHNRQLFFPLMFPKGIRKKTLAVVSPSRDGQYVTDLLAQFGVRSLRGSSSKRGSILLQEAMKELRNKKNVSFTPDGPRGPIYKMSKGPVYLASMTGAPVLPITINYSRYWEIKSWDKFQIPKPFCRITVIIGEPIKIPSEMDDNEFEKYREFAEEKLNEISNLKHTKASTDLG